MNKLLTKKKSKRTTYNSITAGAILLISFLPFLHDWEIFTGKEGFSGFSSLRVAIWVTSLFVIALSGWIVAFINSKSKSYRFVLIVPIAMLVLQLFIYILDARKHSVNDFNSKVVINAILITALVAFFFIKKQRS